MNNTHLKKTLQLIRRTGDKAIIPDDASDEIFVLMGAEAYEKMLPVEKVSANPPLPRPSGELPREFDDQSFDGLVEPLEREVEQVVEEERVSPVVFQKPAPQTITKAPQPLNFDADWSSKDDSATSEESLADVPHDGEEEEKFYLEPVG